MALADTSLAVSDEIVQHAVQQFFNRFVLQPVVLGLEEPPDAGLGGGAEPTEVAVAVIDALQDRGDAQGPTGAGQPALGAGQDLERGRQAPLDSLGQPLQPRAKSLSAMRRIAMFFK